MILHLKQSIPFVVKSCTEISISREWLKQEIYQCAFNLKQTSGVTWLKASFSRFLGKGIGLN